MSAKNFKVKREEVGDLVMLIYANLHSEERASAGPLTNSWARATAPEATKPKFAPKKLAAKKILDSLTKKLKEDPYGVVVALFSVDVAFIMAPAISSAANFSADGTWEKCRCECSVRRWFI